MFLQQTCNLEKNSNSTYKTKHRYIVINSCIQNQYYMHHTWVSPRVKRALPCALGSNPHFELIGRISSGVRPSLLLPPCNRWSKKEVSKMTCMSSIMFGWQSDLLVWHSPNPRQKTRFPMFNYLLINQFVSSKP